jgi:hypothetical protein
MVRRVTCLVSAGSIWLIEGWARDTLSWMVVLVLGS